MSKDAEVRIHWQVVPLNPPVEVFLVWDDGEVHIQRSMAVALAVATVALAYRMGREDVRTDDLIPCPMGDATETMALCTIGWDDPWVELCSPCAGQEVSFCWTEAQANAQEAALMERRAPGVET